MTDGAVSSDQDSMGGAGTSGGMAPTASLHADSPADEVSATIPGAPACDDPRVDDALSRLGEVEALPLAEQVEVFTDIHRRLAAVLADPDSRA